MSDVEAAERWVLPFAEIGMKDVPVVGGKNASLGEMYRELTGKGISVPNGFATTAEAYRYFLRETRLNGQIHHILEGLNPHDAANLAEKGAAVRQAILAVPFPEPLAERIYEAYEKLCREYGAEADVAVRSSATAEDLPEASFAGAQETFLNIRGISALLKACQNCYASLFTDRAIFYRSVNGFDHEQVALSIGVQKMVRSDMASSGVMFTLDTETGFRDVVFITAAYGLGENVVKGNVNPDEFYVFKPTLLKGFRPIIQKNLGSKEIRMVYSQSGEATTVNQEVPQEERERFSLSDDEVLELARWAVEIEDHYSKEAGYHKPMDIEWAKDGLTGGLFIVQARPETIQSRRNPLQSERYQLQGEGRLLALGRAVGNKIGQGKVHIIRDTSEMGAFAEGEVLVTRMTDPDWIPLMKKAAGIITEQGGRTCHAAIVSRELGIPAIVGVEGALEILYNGQEVTLACTGADEGRIYEGILPYHKERSDLQGLPHPRTQVMMNVADPENAFALSFIPNDGVGLARMEFIVNRHIRIHPMALVRYPQLEDASAKEEIDRLTVGYTDKRLFFVDKLAQGVGKIAAAFYPKDVILRMSDFKTNEYANLIGGKAFEPVEDNPMLGFRGASRYTHPLYQEGFALECAAVKHVREEMGLTNLKVMIPFCRTVAEGERVLEEMKANGLAQGENGLEVYVMCELPSNVILAEQFAALFDGFSIGSNDLTQLVLGVDRDSAMLSNLFDEQNEAVLRMIRMLIETAKETKTKVGICGQAPSDSPDFARFLIDLGIDSISLNPDTVIQTTRLVAEREQELAAGTV